VDVSERDPRTLSRTELEAILRQRVTVSVPFAGACCGLSRATAYVAAHDGSLPTIRISGRLLVPTAKLLAMLGLDEPCESTDRTEPEELR
jgi:hypothetical protein